jgi:formylglycine-generating enzyme required for sulfatase activity
MISIPGGTFLMGCTQLEATPIHSVTLSAFKISNTDVTQSEYLRVTGKNPSLFKGDNLLPVENVTWFDAVLYCNMRSKLELKDTVYSFSAISGTPGDGCSGLSNLQINFTKNGYRLPSEAEWEYACRAGTTTDFYWGGSYPPITAADTMELNSNAVWHRNSNDHTWPVGSKKPNAWGLYDMVGNVWQWLNDWNGTYTSAAQTDPTGPASGIARIARGGSYSILDSDLLLRSAIRNGGWYPTDRGYIIGFRVVHR